MPGIVKTEPAEDVKPFDKLRQLPQPPSPRKANPKISQSHAHVSLQLSLANSPARSSGSMTTLTNACTANRKQLNFIEDGSGELHALWWTITCISKSST